MTKSSTLVFSPAAKKLTRSAQPFAAPVSVFGERSASRHQHQLPAQPSAIPVNAAPHLPLQRKLAVGSVNDPLETEADAMAARVLSDEHVAASAASATPAALHRKASSTAVPSVEAPASVHQALRSPGEPLDTATRSSLEPRFGRDLSQVRVHTDSLAAQSAADVQASAYTVGQNVFFAAGNYNPHSAGGKRLLAHELSHTVQQSGGASGHSARLSSAAPAVQREPTPQAAPNASADAQAQPLKGKPAPQFTLQDLNGKKVSLADYKGKAVLLNFWATWCGPCKVEIPWLIKLRDQYKDQGFEVLGIESDNYDTDPKAFAEYKAGVVKSATGLAINYPVLLGGDSISQPYGGLDGLPNSFYVDRDGVVTAQLVGLVDRDEIEANIKKALASGAK